MTKNLALGLLSCSLLFAEPTQAQAPQKDKKIAQAGGRSESLRRSGRPPSQAVRQQLRRADQLFEARDYERALFLYTLILRSSPELIPARVKLARSLYKLARFEDSYRAFRGIPVTELDPEASYEFAQAALKVKDFASALASFQAIPNGHPLYDLANYYGAICASNLKKYRLAARLMRQVVVLPSKLTPSKQAYLKHIEEMIAAEEASSPSESKKMAEKATPLPPPPPPERQAPSGPGFGEPPQHQVRGGYYAVSQEQTLTEGTKERHRRLSPFVEWHQVRRIPIDASRQDDPDHMRAHLRLRLDQFNQSLRERRMIENEMQELTRTVRSQSQSDQVYVSELGAGLLPQWHLSQDLWLLAGGQFMAAFPDFSPGKAYSHLIGVVGIGRQKTDYEALLRLRVIDTGGEAKRQYTRTEQDLMIHLLPQARFSINILARLAQYSYTQDKIDGPDQLAMLQVQGKIRLLEMSHLIFGGHIERLQGQRHHEIQDIPVIGYNQSASGGELSLSVETLPWLHLELGLRTQNRRFDRLEPQNADTRTILESVEPSQVFEVAAQAVFNWQF